MITIDIRCRCNLLQQTGRVAAMLILAIVGMPWTASGQQPPDFPPEPLQEELLPSPPADDNMTVLTRGPLHEAFAAAYLSDPKPVLPVMVQPPEPIDEIPPAFKPDGENIEWIPGYWEWDSDQNDFIWISGIWREVPPGQQWIPGYWAEEAEGWQRISGFWTSPGTEEIDYLPMPPQSVENGPSSNPPGVEYFYVPGNWVYQANSYAWQAGYWAPAHEHLVWIPAQYYWTPRGCVYVAGYWDYEFSNRGLVFAPVHFDRHYHTRPNFRYTPDCVIDVNANLLIHLFVNTGNHNYYFGDFYGSNYANHYHPWYDVNHQRYRYDPLVAYYQVNFGGHSSNIVQWSRKHHEWFAKNRNARPPRTLRQQKSFGETARQSGIDHSNIRLATLGVSIQDMAKSAKTPSAGSPKSKPGKLTREHRQQLGEQKSPDLPKENKGRKINQPGSSINPPVQPPGNRGSNSGSGGGNKEGGNKKGGNKGGGNREGGNREGGNREGGNREGGNREGGNREGGNREGGNREGGNKGGGKKGGGKPK